MQDITLGLVKRIIKSQFPEYASLSIEPVKTQGHDNRSFRLGDSLLIRMPTKQAYVHSIYKEQKLLPKLAKHISINIPTAIKMGLHSEYYPYPFSIYKWLNGEDANHFQNDDAILINIAIQLANFLKELQAIKNIDGPLPGEHNFWRGAHISIYDAAAYSQITALDSVINIDKAKTLWTEACKTKWNNIAWGRNILTLQQANAHSINWQHITGHSNTSDTPFGYSPVWIHGDLASGNILIKDNKLSAVIDFGCVGMGDPACDLVIAWTLLHGQSRKIFKESIELDANTWLRAKAWAIWKATFELCNIANKNTYEAYRQKKIIEEVLNDE